MRVGVEGLRGTGVAQTRLHRLHRFAVPDEKAGVVGTQLVDRGTGPTRRTRPSTLVSVRNRSARAVTLSLDTPMNDRSR